MYRNKGHQGAKKMPTILKHFPEESNLHDQRFFQVFFSVSDTSSKMEEGGSVMVKSF